MDDEASRQDEGGHRATDGLDWGRQVPQPPSPPLPPLNVAPTVERSAWRIAALTVVGALFAGILGGTVAALLVTDAQTDGDGQPARPAAAAPGILSIEQTSAIAESVARARPAVVRIESTRRLANGAIEQDVGSGVVFDQAGHIVTNAHVVLGTDTLKVILSDGTERPGILLGHDYPFTDVAVLQIGAVKVTPLQFGDSSALKLGETVVAIGNPLAEFDGSVSVGVISGLNRVRTFDTVRQDDVIQTDASINNGNSGGALLNLRGELIGIPTAILRQSRGGQIVEGISFALPSNRVAEIARRIVFDGASYPRPALGLEHADITAELLRQLPRGTPEEGAIVTAVAAGGPAAAVGFQPGDVITNVGDQSVTRKNPLLNTLLKYQPGQTVRVVFNRNGRIIEAEVRLAKRG